MREIKFRVWDLRVKTMGKPVSLLKMLVEAFNFNDWEELVFLQYTGLKDKNGVEIYEGDIVRWELGHTLVKEEVEWSHYGNGGYNPFSDEMGPLSDEAEVIGNIYENPELLEG